MSTTQDALVASLTALARLRNDETCDRITEVTRVGDSIVCDSFWRQGGKGHAGSSVRAMARDHLRRGETLALKHSTTIPLPGNLRARTTVYVVMRTDNSTDTHNTDTERN